MSDVSAVTQPNFDEMSPKQVREWAKDLSWQAKQFREIQATLIEKYRPGRGLYEEFGIAYDESNSVLLNLLDVLKTLTFTARDLRENMPQS